MNPFQHSDVAAAIYKILCTKSGLDQESEGKLACEIADMLAKDFDVELQPLDGDEDGDIE